MQFSIGEIATPGIHLSSLPTYTKYPTLKGSFTITSVGLEECNKSNRLRIYLRKSDSAGGKPDSTTGILQ